MKVRFRLEKLSRNNGDAQIFIASYNSKRLMAGKN
jgi:hypothetical protein